MVNFTLLFPATCFGSIYSSHLQAEVLFTLEGDIYTIGNTVVDCEISQLTRILSIV